MKWNQFFSINMTILSMEINIDNNVYFLFKSVTYILTVYSKLIKYNTNIVIPKSL